MVKSELRGEYVMTNPAIVAAKDNTAAAVAGSAAGTLLRCFPPTPKATTKATMTGIQDIRSYQERTLIPQKDTYVALGLFGMCTGIENVQIER